ncbi:MAG: hypothetical protein OEM82_09430, partial [Acidobacteriota bacterium]|nr:hypothetical protein [Acidobacteriota bacterium]
MWNKETTKKAIGLLSRNLQFVLVFLISLTALLWVWQQDREFHNDKPMPIIIVGEKGPEDSKEADTGRFSVSEIQNLIAPEQSLAPDQMNILELGLLDLNQLKLNDVGDLKNRLTERLIAQRDNKQNFLRTRIDGLELERLRNKFEMLNQYRTDTTDSTTSVDIESLISDLQAKQSAKDASVRNSRISINVPQS